MRKSVVLVLALAPLLGCSAEGGDPRGNGAFPDGGGTGSPGNGSGPGGGNGSGGGVGGGLGDSLNQPDGGALPTPSGTVCGRQTVDLKRQPADVLVVLDRSGSMTDAPRGSSESKWQQVTGALSEVLTKTEKDVRWGLKLYPMPVGQACSVPTGIEVTPDLSRAAEVQKHFTDFAPQENRGGTPTQAAVRRATEQLRMLQSTNPKYLLLATDGLPNCRRNVGRDDDDDDGAVDAIADAAAAGIPTFVVGIALGSEARETLNRMADAGERPRNDPQTKFYAVANREELVTALSTITGQVVSCTFALEKQPPSPDDVAVELGTMRVPRSATEGWEYAANRRAIELHGSFCETLKTRMAPVKIIFGCPNEPIP